MEAVKQTFAVKPKGMRVRARVLRPALAPAPIGGAPVSRAPDPGGRTALLERGGEHRSLDATQAGCRFQGDDAL